MILQVDSRNAEWNIMEHYYKTLHIKTTKLERASWFLRSIKEKNYSIKNVPEDVTFAKIV